jgi:hypothetical protein
VRDSLIVIKLCYLLALPVRERLKNDAEEFIWSHILRIFIRRAWELQGMLLLDCCLFKLGHKGQNHHRIIMLVLAAE